MTGSGRVPVAQLVTDRFSFDQAVGAFEYAKCSTDSGHKAYEVLIHETGHALGIRRLKINDTSDEFKIGHPFNGGSRDTVMANFHVGSDGNLGFKCFPHPFDVMAMYALYQSR